MSFLKAKTTEGEAVLIAVSNIVSVVSNGKTTIVATRDGADYDIDLGFQSVSNRLKELGSNIA